ncbi:MAG: PaaI family thioesterase [Betaproteobacteria bacterium]
MSYGVIGLDVLKTVSGLELLRGMIAGKYPGPPMAALLDFRLISAEKGRAVFEAEPGLKHYNPLGVVHGGLGATMLDSCMACAVQTMLDAGVGYTTIEFKVTFLRPMTEKTGVVQAIGEVINVGRRLGVSEGRLIDSQGKILAHATTSCLIFPV